MHILKDVKRYYPNRNLLCSIPYLLFNPGFMAVLYYRIANFLYLNRVPLIPKLIMFTARIIWGIEIGYSARIDEGFRLTHGCGTVIGGDVIIGKNVTILHQVTLGTNFKNKREYKGKTITQPVIQDECMVLAGAKIVGPVIVGNNSVIGANSVVTKDVEPGWVYAGIPAKRIKRNELYGACLSDIKDLI